MKSFLVCALICATMLAVLLQQTEAQEAPPMPHMPNGGGGGGGHMGHMMRAGFLKAAAQRGPQGQPSHGGGPPHHGGQRSPGGQTGGDDGASNANNAQD